MSGGAAYLEPSSLMDDMMALFAPPGRGDSSLHRSQVELHPYYKRPGKGHNHDSCDACGEGGDLICCDNCPASFHFACHAPPLEEEDIPLGDWICLRCYHREQLRLVTANANMTMNMVGVNSKQQKEGNVEQGEDVPKEDSSFAANDLLEDTSNLTEPPISDDEGFTPGSSINGAQSQPTTRSDTKKNRGRHNKHRQAAKKTRDPKGASEKGEKQKNVKKIYRLKYEKYLRVKPATSSPFDMLVAASQVTNADQFKLPREMEMHEKLPFSWKWSNEIREADLRDNEDDSPRCCTACFKTCRGVPSVGCDFCSSIYHLDCLDPPLCEPPRQERWMCPNHVENFIDSNLVSSTSLTERLKLWTKYGGSKSGSGSNFNPDSIKLEFFRKVRKGKLYERGVKRARVIKRDQRIRVPQYIKNHYRNPICGLSVEQGIPQLPHSDPTAMDMIHSNSTNSAPGYQSNGQNEDTIFKQEHDEWLAQLVGLQIGLLKRQMLNSTSPENKSTTSEETLEDKKSRKDIVGKSRKVKVTLEKRQALLGKKLQTKAIKTEDVGPQDNETGGSKDDGLHKYKQSLINTNTSTDKVSGKSTQRVDEISTDVEKVNQAMNDVDKAIDNEDTHSTCSSTASECSLGDLADDDGFGVQTKAISSDARSEIYEYLARMRKSKGAKGYSVDSFDPVLKDFLAIQRVEQLFSKQTQTFETKLTPESITSTHMVQSRAALVPLNNPRCRDPCHIQRRSVDIGLGVACGIDLSKVGHCNYISAKHATIFFDQYSRVYELINYSDHGTIVDNIIYTLNPISCAANGKEVSNLNSNSSSNIHAAGINNNTADPHSEKGGQSTGKKSSLVPKNGNTSNSQSFKAGNSFKKMSANTHQFSSNEREWKACSCTDSIQRTMNALNCEYSAGGCENSAILHHGSYIRFGCLQFAFTVVDYTNDHNPSMSKNKQENCINGNPTDDQIKRNGQEQGDDDNNLEIKNLEVSKINKLKDTPQLSESMEIDP